MVSKCAFCYKEFVNISHNRILCYDNHFVNCIVCNQSILLNTRKFRKLNEVGYLCCSAKCGNIQSSKLRVEKRDTILDLDLLRYYVEETAESYKDIASLFNTSIDHILDRINRYGMKRPDYLNEMCALNKNKKISRILKEKYSDSNYKDMVENKKRMTYFNKTGFYHNFQNPEFKKQAKVTRYKKYGKYQSPIQEKSVKDIPEEEKLIRIQHQKETMLRKYNKLTVVRKLTQEEIIKRNNNIKLGWNNKTKEEKQQMVAKVKATKKLRYNDENYNNQEKIRKTNIEKYGVDNIFKRVDIMEEAMEQKYGVKYSQQIHLSSTTLDIISNETSYRDYIKSLPEQDRCVYSVCKNLGISYSKFFTLRLNYHCDDLIKLNNISSLEKEITELLDGINITYMLHNRDVIKPLELDIYIPVKNVAIECNGVYWHSTSQKPDVNYHYNKSKLCEEKGIRLIHVWEYEWNNERQRPILENIIKSALGINEYKLYARKLDIEVRESKTMQNFFDKNNIQGFRGGRFTICLVDKKQGEYDLLGNYKSNTGKVYMAYMMGHPFFGKGKYEWEVIRGATELGYTIIGGASKIFNYFIKTYHPKNCVYYIDYNYFNGNSLKYLGNMEFVKTQPSFKNYFVKEGIIKNRDPLHHKQITDGYKDGTILQVWNAGTKVYVWESKKE